MECDVRRMAWCAVLLAGCAAPAAAPPSIPGPSTASVAHLDDYARAVVHGTRDSTGRPGARYWQQYAKYDLRAELIPQNLRLMGTGHVRYYNNSPDSLPRIAIQLYQNIQRTVVSRMGGSLTDGMHLTRVATEGRELAEQDSLATSAGWSVSGTIGWITLPRALAAHDSLDLDFAWHFSVPKGAQRMGTDGSMWFLAYWYPQIAVYDDVDGWQTDQYLGTGEFYMGYADYDVQLTVPEGYSLDATGELLNASDVWSDSTRARLALARTSDSVVHVVRADDRGAGPARATRHSPNGKLVWTWRARDVRDFVFGASRDYLVDATRALVPAAGGQQDTVDIRAMYRPAAARWTGAARDGRFAVEFHSRALWPYPWSHMSIIEGPEPGMEYPMMTQIAAFGDSTTLFEVIAHEIGHMWFPMMVGSDEKRHAWMDEGFTQYDESRADEAFDSTNHAELDSQRSYESFAKTTGEEAMDLCADCYRQGSDAYVIAAYEKPVAVLRALRGVLGDSLYVASFREYGRRWRDKHPQPQDFFETVEDVSHRHLGWFWYEWFDGTGMLDQAIDGLAVHGDSLAITIGNRGEVVMPVFLAITRADGSVQRLVVSESAWRNNTRVTVSVRATPAVTLVEIDPSAIFPDVNRRNQRARP